MYRGWYRIGNQGSPMTPPFLEYLVVQTWRPPIFKRICTKKAECSLRSPSPIDIFWYEILGNVIGTLVYVSY